jgi:hypothetical protein
MGDVEAEDDFEVGDDIFDGCEFFREEVVLLKDVLALLKSLLSLEVEVLDEAVQPHLPVLPKVSSIHLTALDLLSQQSVNPLLDHFPLPHLDDLNVIV